MDKVGTKTKSSKNYTNAVGRRREAVARVRIYTAGGKIEVFGEERERGDIIINKKPVMEYFSFASSASKYKKLLGDAGVDGKYIISARITGGGLNGQLEAFVHGVARALDKIDKEKHHKILSDNGYLTRDPRTRERRKVGNAGKARRKKQSPKR
ncbi:MAG: 30S ribosomal protein S9 [Candidatus Levybacteria bacterium]|nr:30S ribosomal protein S9 [Candidatus Levybacteria bacterium]MBP9814888.1 30S ribosomal protein S9 [Candidatus Levybacteria bacterium]